jgi:hypothetical protein
VREWEPRSALSRETNPGPPVAERATDSTELQTAFGWQRRSHRAARPELQRVDHERLF